MKTINGLRFYTLDEFIIAHNRAKSASEKTVLDAGSKIKPGLGQLALNRCKILSKHGYLFIKCANPYLDKKEPWSKMSAVRVLHSKRAGSPPFAIWGIHDPENPRKGPLVWSELEKNTEWYVGQGRPVGSTKDNPKSAQIWTRMTASERDELATAAATQKQSIPEFVRTRSLEAARLINGSCPELGSEYLGLSRS